MQQYHWIQVRTFSLRMAADISEYFVIMFHLWPTLFTGSNAWDSTVVARSTVKLHIADWSRQDVRQIIMENPINFQN